MGKSCCFIGHRTVKENNELLNKIRQTVVTLIKEGVDNFLFGSRSDFDYLCYKTVSELRRDIFLDISRKCYTCSNEKCLFERDRQYWEKIYNNLKVSKSPMFFEEEVEYKNRQNSGKARYVERNKAMIDDSDICVFYYDENYLPPTRKRSLKDFMGYQPNSGTAIAYNYAKKKGKKIYNLFK